MKTALLTTLLTISSFSSLASASNSWRNLTALPVSRQEHSAAVCTLTEKLYIAGGITPPTLATDTFFSSYSASTNTWTTLPSLPQALNHLNLAAAPDGRIFILGGLAEGPGGWIATQNCYVFNPHTQSWKNLTSTAGSMPVPRGSASVAVWDGKIFLAGGITKLELVEGGVQDTVADVSVFDLKTLKWLAPATTMTTTMGASLPEGRDHAGGAQIGHELFVLGGRTHGQQNVRNTTFILDLTEPSKGWRKGAEMPTARGSVTAAAVGSKIYTFGGEGNADAVTGVFADVEVYDTKKDCWEKLEDMPVPRHGMPGGSLGGVVVIPGGGLKQGGESPVANVDAFVP